MLRKENNLQPNQSQWSLDSCDFTSRFVSSQKKKFHKVAFQKSQLEHPSGAHVARKGQAYSVGGIQKETCSLTDTCLPLPGYTHTLIHMKQLETKLAGYFVQFFSTSCTAILSSLLYGIPISRCNIDSLYSEHQKSVHYKLQVCFPEGCITKQMHVCVYYTYILWLSE